MSNPIYQLLERSSDEVILMDGGMGTTVQDRGVDIANRLWGSYALMTGEGRTINDQIHQDFVAAGAEILIANTHNAGEDACAAFLTQHDLRKVELPQNIFDDPPADQAASLNAYIIQEAVASARRAISHGRTIAVATCIGSVEGAYATESHHSVDAIQQVMEREIEVHRAAGTDLLIFETLTTRQEIEGVARAARIQGLTEVGIGLTCGSDGRTLARVSMGAAVDIFADVQPVAYFIQCTNFDIVKTALKDLSDELGSCGITGVYANDGRNWRPPVWHGERVSPRSYGEAALEWRDLGARIIGGCCGTQPEHIAELERLLGRRSRPTIG